MINVPLQRQCAILHQKFHHVGMNDIISEFFVITSYLKGTVEFLVLEVDILEPKKAHDAVEKILCMDDQLVTGYRHFKH